MTQEQRTRWLRLLALVFAVGLTLFLYLNRHRVQHLQGYGYAGIFLVSLLTNATLILPIPGVLIGNGGGLYPLLGCTGRRKWRGSGRAFRVSGGIQWSGDR